MESTDVDLLRRIAAGEESALGDFYDRHSPRILGLLLRWVGHRSDAEDVLQEVFWQVWCRAGSFDATRAAPIGWLFLLARSRALDHLRRRRSNPAVDASTEPMSLDDPLADLERHELFLGMRDAVSRLPQEQSRAIFLAFFTGLTHEEVAEQEAIPIGTAKTRIRLGIRRLRSYLSSSEECP